MNASSLLTTTVRDLLFIARASGLYRPRPQAWPRGHGELLKLLQTASHTTVAAGRDRSAAISISYALASRAAAPGVTVTVPPTPTPDLGNLKGAAWARLSSRRCR